MTLERLSTRDQHTNPAARISGMLCAESSLLSRATTSFEQRQWMSDDASSICLSDENNQESRPFSMSGGPAAGGPAGWPSLHYASPGESPGSSEAYARITHALLARHCAYAIHLGCPLYNAGAIRECCSLYEEAISRALTATVTPMRTRLIFEAARKEAQLLVSASRKAWVLRNALNDVIDLARSPVSVMCRDLLDLYQ